jgi:hypothetical protein
MATDASGNVAAIGFFVTVVGPQDQLTQLSNLVEQMNLQQGIENSLDSKLANAQAALAAAQAGDLATACNLLDAFINDVKAQTGKKITLAEANQLILAADRIKAVLGCP